MYNKKARTKWVAEILPRFVTRKSPMPTLKMTAIHPTSPLCPYLPANKPTLFIYIIVTDFRHRQENIQIFTSY